MVAHPQIVHLIITVSFVSTTLAGGALLLSFTVSMGRLNLPINSGVFAYGEQSVPK